MLWRDSRRGTALAACLLLSCGEPGSGSRVSVATHPLAGGVAVEPVQRPPRTHPAGTTFTSIRQGGRPFGLAVSRTGLVYCTLLDSAKLIRTTLGGETVSTVPVAAVPTDVAFSPAGNWGYVTNQMAGTIGLIDTRTNRQVDVIPVDGDPFRVAVGPEGQQVYATTNLGNLVQIDATTRTVTWTVPLGGNLNGLTLSSDGTRIYVGDVDGKIYEADSAGDVLRSMMVPGRPQGLVLSADGKELYAAGEAGDLIVLDLETGTERARTPLGGGGFGIAVTPDQSAIWVTAPAIGRVIVLDRSSLSIVTTLALGGKPRRIAFDPSGSTAVVADESGAIHLVR